jgi:hypothetical protein
VEYHALRFGRSFRLPYGFLSDVLLKFHGIANEYHQLSLDLMWSIEMVANVKSGTIVGLCTHHDPGGLGLSPLSAVRGD